MQFPKEELPSLGWEDEIVNETVTLWLHWTSKSLTKPKDGNTYTDINVRFLDVAAMLTIVPITLVVMVFV